MNTSKLADIAEITSSIAILVTLVFLVLQMQQNTEAIQAQTQQSLLASQQNELLTRVENPEIVLSMVKTETLTPRESVKLDAWLKATLRSRDFAWHQYQNGLIDRGQWASEENVLKTVLTPRTNREWWNKIDRQTHDADFADYVDDLLRKLPVSDNYYNTILNWTAN